MRPRGVVVPLLTAFKKDESLDEEALRSHVEFMIENGVHGLFALGTAGEIFLLSRVERDGVIEVVVDQANGRLPVYAGVSDPGTSNVVENAKRAKDVGVDAVVATPPYYFRTTDEGIIAHFRTIVEKAETPLIIYNIPEWTHQEISLHAARALAEEDLIVGMKYTTGNLASFINYLSALGGKISMLIGADSLLYSALDAGADGGVLGSANVAPKQMVEIYDAFTDGRRDEAKRIQRSMLPLANAMNIGTFPSALKEMMEAIGRPLGPVRKPLMPLKADEKKIVREALAQTGLIR